jgi:C-terminal processing protease CtpA/Prc
MQDDGAGSPVFIKSLVTGGSCDKDGICRAGDFVVAVNNEKVAHLPVVEIREKIVGPMGTSVVILFQRPNGEFYEE